MIAVDGPAGAGKSSAARGVATKLGLRYLDTGAMYRALTWFLITQRLDVADPAVVAANAGRPAIEVGTDPDRPAIAVDGVDVSGEIRSRDVSNAVSAVASVPEVRAHLIAQQRDILARACAAGEGIVAEALREAAADGAGPGLKAVTGLLDEGTAGVTRIPGKHSKPRGDDMVVQVVIPDVPGELARLFRAAGDAGVNIEDIGIEHSPGLPVGVAELVVRPEAVARLTQALAASGWPVRR